MRNPIIPALAAASIAFLPSAVNAQSADQLNAASAPPPASTTEVVGANPADDAIVTDYPGNMATAPAPEANKTYPLCTARLQDNCQNRGEGGAPGRSRALKHWPGKPVSEM